MELITLWAMLDAGRSLDDGEPVDLLAHALQCAALVAETSPEDLDLQVAGLVHDVGTALDPDNPATHAATGAAAVRPLLGSRVAWLVDNHDAAKRYLVTTDPAYRNALSPRSTETLTAQGGFLSADAVDVLSAEPDLGALLELRRADDSAKVPGQVVPPLEHWRPIVEAVAARQP